MIGNLIIAVIGYGAAIFFAVFAALSIPASYWHFQKGQQGKCRGLLKGVPVLVILALVFATATKLVTAL